MKILLTLVSILFLIIFVLSFLNFENPYKIETSPEFLKQLDKVKDFNPNYNLCPLDSLSQTTCKLQYQPQLGQ